MDCPDCRAAIAYLKQQGPWPSAQLDTHSEVERLAQLLRIEVLVKGALLDLADSGVGLPPAGGAAVTFLPKRNAQELAWALRERAERLTGQGWELAATKAMMIEAADLLASHPEGWQPKWREKEVTPMFKFKPPYTLAKMSAEAFLMGMSSLGTAQEIQVVGSFAPADDTSTRTAHRDVDLPFHRDGIYTKSLADMQDGHYVEKPNVDIVGLYCLRDNGGRGRCVTILSHDERGQSLVAEVELQQGDALIWDNRLWHGRRGPVGDRLLIRFWTTLPPAPAGAPGAQKETK